MSDAKIWKLPSSSRSEGSLVSKQQLSQLNFKDINCKLSDQDLNVHLTYVSPIVIIMLCVYAVYYGYGYGAPNVSKIEDFDSI